MASYEINVPEVGVVRVNKRRGMKTIRLRVSPRGEILVSAPWYVSRSIINTFLQERKTWMLTNSRSRHVLYKDGMFFGRNLKLVIMDSAHSNHSRIKSSELVISLKDRYESGSTVQQKYIEGRMIKAMHTEAEHTLLPVLHRVSLETGINFNQAFIKNLTGRWGSCDSKMNILLSVFLVQVPDELARYVMIHELAHTLEMNHSPKFWAIVEFHCPDYKKLRKSLKQYSPRVTERV